MMRTKFIKRECLSEHLSNMILNKIDSVEFIQLKWSLKGSDLCLDVFGGKINFEPKLSNIKTFHEIMFETK